MKKTLVTVDEDFGQIDRLLKELRIRIARAAEAVHVVAENATRQHRGPLRKRAKRR